MITLLVALCGLSLAAPPSPPAVSAAEPVVAPKPTPLPANALALGSGLVLSSTGELRYIGTLPPALTLDADGTQPGQGAVLDQRLRAGITLKSRPQAGGATQSTPGFTLTTSWDLFTGQLAGDPWDVPGTIDERHREEIGVLTSRSFIPRAAEGAVIVGPVGVSAGLTTSHWGLGMLANDGAHDPEFGRADFGDRVLRVRVATRPFGKGEFPLGFSLAADRVVQDDLVHAGALSEGGQVAWQGLAAVLLAPKNGNKLGLYGVYRNQLEPVLDGETEGRTTRLGVVDVFGQASLPLGQLQLRVGGEAAEVAGHTTRSETYNSTDGLDIVSGGATGYFGVAGAARTKVVDATGATGTQKRDLWSAKVRMGWASGDGDPDDDVSNDFTFDRDYDAGMLLFDEQAGGIEAANYALVSDPANTGHTPDGAEVTVTEGSVKRASFLQPVVDFQPMAWLGLRAGVMAAWSTAPIAQPFYSFRNGGSPTNHMNQPTSGRALGTEIDWAVRVGGVALGSANVKVRPELLLQGAHLFSSVDMGGGKATMVTATARARW